MAGEQIPQWDVVRGLRHPSNGDGEALELSVKLPGVTNASAIIVKLNDAATAVECTVPGLFSAPSIPLGVAVDRTPLLMRFIRQEQFLKAQFAVKGGGAGASSTSRTAATHEVEDGDDVDIYSLAKEQANKESAAQCFQEAQDATTAGDWPRAVRLLTKATQLDPGNAAYEGALPLAKAAEAQVNTAGTSGSGGRPSGSAGAQPQPVRKKGKKGKSKSKRHPSEQEKEKEQGETDEPAKRDRDNITDKAVVVIKAYYTLLRLFVAPNELDGESVPIVVARNLLYLILAPYLWIWAPLQSVCPPGMTSCSYWIGATWYLFFVASSFWHALTAYYVLSTMVPEFLGWALGLPSPAMLNRGLGGEVRGWGHIFLLMVYGVFISALQIVGHAFMVAWAFGGGEFGVLAILYRFLWPVLPVVLPGTAGVIVETLNGPRMMAVILDGLVLPRIVWEAPRLLGKALFLIIAAVATPGNALWLALTFPFRPHSFSVLSVWMVTMWAAAVPLWFDEPLVLDLRSSEDHSIRLKVILLAALYVLAYMPVACTVGGGPLFGLVLYVGALVATNAWGDSAVFGFWRAATAGRIGFFRLLGPLTVAYAAKTLVCQGIWGAAVTEN